MDVNTVNFERLNAIHNRIYCGRKISKYEIVLYCSKKIYWTTMGHATIITTKLRILYRVLAELINTGNRDGLILPWYYPGNKKIDDIIGTNSLIIIFPAGIDRYNTNKRAAPGSGKIIIGIDGTHRFF